MKGLEVKFDTPITLKNNVVTDTITIVRVIDEPGRKKALAFGDKFRAIILWEGNDYDTAGQWTDTDVVNRYKELVLKMI